MKTAVALKASGSFLLRVYKKNIDMARITLREFSTYYKNKKECSTLMTQNGEESIRRGDIYYADLSPVVGSEQGGIRPVLIVQNNMGNRYSPTVIAAAITSRTGKTKLPTHIEVSADVSNGLENRCGLAKNSVILLEQIRTIDKQRLKERMGKLDEQTMHRVDSAIGISFGLM